MAKQTKVTRHPAYRGDVSSIRLDRLSRRAAAACRFRPAATTSLKVPIRRASPIRLLTVHPRVGNEHLHRRIACHLDWPSYFWNHQTMKEGPDISIIAALIGNPASANMLMALMAGPALTATELAQEAGLMLSTASGHLAKLENAGLVAVEPQGPQRYFRLADPDVAGALEGP